MSDIVLYIRLTYFNKV